MGLRSTLGVGLGGAALALGTVVAVSTSAQAATWTATKPTKYADIRSCYRATCGSTGVIFPGMKVWWSHYAYNSAGNKWYYVKNDNGNKGWVYCKNVSAGC
ncbi:hypothetical protein ACQB60_29815 [Actinomycetota bacterium Odt1-20B]